MTMAEKTEKVSLEIVTGPTHSRDDDGWEHMAYTVKLHYQGRSMTTPWKQGLGITDDPSASSVLENLFLDAGSYDNARDFEDWAENYGFDTDSRKAEATYKAVGKQSDKLAKLIYGKDYVHDGMVDWMTEDAEELAKRYAES